MKRRPYSKQKVLIVGLSSLVGFFVAAVAQATVPDTQGVAL
jgi:hypothetical protein